ncbi:spermatogenesis-associated protein 24-like [Clavelina lepadiformis]|uniref:spermatogenesis-associated protein 24-like n=1 Tax=Clavelina lepadiformis TaxID=159417 RepID=UPI0040438988
MEDFGWSSKNGAVRASSPSISSHSIVRNAMEDVFKIQRNQLDHVRSTIERQKSNYIPKTTHDEVSNALKHEKLDHTKTKLLLDKEKDKLEFTFGENEILKTQMQNQKEEYESQIRALQSKATRETKRCDFLHQQCMEMEMKLEKLTDIGQLKDNEILKLRQRLKILKENHKVTLEEIDINRMQEDYIKTLSDSQKRKV